ncbi:MAG: hypothetical protein ACE5GW_00670 [Planctomycetota bacterium]
MNAGPRKVLLRHRLPLLALAPLLLLLLGARGCESERPEAPRKPLDRGTFFVAITETLEGEPTEVNIAEHLITRTLLGHGLTPAPRRENARYLLEGTLTCAYHKELTFEFGDMKQLLEHQYKALFECSLTDTRPGAAAGESSGEHTSGEPDVEVLDFPEPLINGRTDRKLARRDIRRRAATNICERMMNGRLLGRPEIKGLLDALGDPLDPRTFNDIAGRLAAIGIPAVPYLLDALRDDRPVRMKGDYAGLEERNLDAMRYYHVADLALGEILRRSSGLAIDSTEEMHLRVITGWTWAWEDLEGIPEVYRVYPEQRKSSVPAPVAE